MKKTFPITDLDCAHCAAKIETAIAKLDGVQAVNVSFLLQQVTIEADDACFDSIVRQAADLCRKIEPDCRLIV